ncbi:MAG: hypothetical protein ACRYGP_19520 [Janthinobacterium lividum]
MSVRAMVSSLLLCAAVLIFVFHPFTPELPRAGIDPSWVAVMGEAADRPARWGIDTLFTYGPASPLVTGYYNAAFFTRTVPLLFGFAALFAWCAALLIAGGSSLAMAAGTVAVGVMVSAARNSPDVMFLSLPFLVFLVALRAPEQRGATEAACCGAFAMGLTAMVKMSFPLAALPLFIFADVIVVWRQQRVPRFVPLFALGIVAGTLLYGQHLSDLPAYAIGQGEVVAGYAAAMAIDGPDWDLAAFLVAAAALLASVVIARRGRDRWTVSLGLAMAILFLFKAGFIRHDLHSMIAWSGLALLGTVLAWSHLPRRTALAVLTAVGFVVLVYEPIVTVRQSVRVGRGEALADLYRDWFVDTPRRAIAATASALRDPYGFPAKLDAAKAAAWASIAAASPLPPLPGTVDILPSAQTRVMAAGLAYRGRPSFQEYSTYSAGLAEANRRFIDNPDAPRWILFGPESPLGFMSIDQRYPSLSEGPLWPDLLRLYRPDRRIGDLVALARRPVPASVQFGPPRSLAVGFGTFSTIDVETPLWATLDLRLNLAGRVLSALFRPPLLTLAVKLDDGSERRFRLVPALAASGFLLSPLVDNASDYEDLAADRLAGAGRRVTALAVEVSRSGRLFYGPDIAITLRALDLSGLAEAEGPAADATAWDALLRAEPAAEDKVRAPASDVLTLPLRHLPDVGGQRHVALSAGTGPGARPVCFSASAADGTGKELWRACTTPDGSQAETPLGLSIDVPDSITELALAASCHGGSCEAYWTAPAPSAQR